MQCQKLNNLPYQYALQENLPKDRVVRLYSFPNVSSTTGGSTESAINGTTMTSNEYMRDLKNLSTLYKELVPPAGLEKDMADTLKETHTHVKWHGP
ncbi:unnamed protein product [Nippostrongylus brasiliensis]|uniref:Late endosomal/lysosomal adaptor and MAPK and MTOR activator 1 n=1 Tax=Nippostrongylus brasiliensis TaxID=27835 RepID=A0A0N4YAD9_NIPBR|nr:unnamed protein product [Nippostrongylus brasiliensis]